MPQKQKSHFSIQALTIFSTIFTNLKKKDNGPNMVKVFQIFLVFADFFPNKRLF
jgi:hypothetical protein